MNLHDINLITYWTGERYCDELQALNDQEECLYSIDSLILVLDSRIPVLEILPRISNDEAETIVQELMQVIGLYITI